MGVCVCADLEDTQWRGNSCVGGTTCVNSSDNRPHPRMLLLLALVVTVAGVVAGQCNTTFIKVSVRAPSSDMLVLLYSSPGTAVTLECVRRCRASADCPAVVVDYETSSCFRVTSNSSRLEVGGRTPDRDIGSGYFVKVCVPVPPQCAPKAWVLEETPGYELVTSYQSVVTNVTSSMACGLLCLRERGFECRSALYDSRARRCQLTVHDRRGQPDSYRAAVVTRVYWENQCVPPVFPPLMCALEEYPNSTMCCADRSFEGISQSECISRCFSEANFTCRGSTFVTSGEEGGHGRCLLHGEDTRSVGVMGVMGVYGAAYWERAACLRVLVTCSEHLMTVSLHTDAPFHGRLYVRGRSDVCNSAGGGGYDVTLDIPLKADGGGVDNKCGVLLARSVGETNRTLVIAVVIVQNNPIIQRRGDRALRVACVLDHPRLANVTVGAALSFGGPGAITGGATLVTNTSAAPPTVSLRITDPLASDRDVKEVLLGQDLQLRVTVDPDDGPYDIRPFHLVASSADEFQSYLLLDDRGCPSDPQAFPALRRAGNGSRSLLADFRAFKFPNSEVVLFNVTVTFCPAACPAVQCSPAPFPERVRRGVVPAAALQGLPLQVTLVVRSPAAMASAVIEPATNNSHILTAHFWPGDPHQVCMQWGTLLGVALAWVLLQFVILAACYVASHWRPRPRTQDLHRLHEDFPRHVRWADGDQ